MGFHTLNYPSYKLGYVNTDRTLYKTRSNRVLAMRPSSFLLNTDEGGKSGSNTASTSNDSDNSLLSLDNTVGIIGGVSVDSTLKFMRKLVQWGSRDEDSIPFVLCSDPMLSKDLLSHERSSLPSLSGRKTERTQVDPAQIAENLRSKRIFLENSGARCIVMPCHISHSWHEEVFKGCNVPFFHMGECVAKQLKEANLKPLEAGSPLRIGVLATNATLTAGFYQKKLQNEGFEVVLPDKATMEHTVVPAIEAISRKDIEGARNLFRIALQVLLVRAVNSVILASDDMRGLLPHDDPLLKKCVDPMDALAWSTINWAQSAEIGK
ncbi:Asp/Glu racemase [Parasponia andersonii]|uniref:Asp/Glu racemase n=1 Tax=Parasponia andersonii TaxID=3476 RepID=A0A2P5BQE5_PARAD|nr:Asp/Glu racemase [Parasponia andersonii]